MSSRPEKRKKKSGSQSPKSKSGSQSPKNKSRSQSPKSKSRSQSPKSKSRRSQSPPSCLNARRTHIPIIADNFDLMRQVGSFLSDKDLLSLAMTNKEMYQDFRPLIETRRIAEAQQPNSIRLEQNLWLIKNNSITRSTFDQRTSYEIGSIIKFDDELGEATQYGIITAFGSKKNQYIVKTFREAKDWYFIQSFNNPFCDF